MTGARKNAENAERWANGVLPDIEAALRQGARNYREIAAYLNRQHVPTRNGGQWYAATVHRALGYTGHFPPDRPAPIPRRSTTRTPVSHGSIIDTPTRNLRL